MSVITARLWVMRFTNSDSDRSDRPRSTQLPSNKMKNASVSTSTRIWPTKDGLRGHFPDNAIIAVGDGSRKWIASSGAWFLVTFIHHLRKRLEQ